MNLFGQENKGVLPRTSGHKLTPTEVFLRRFKQSSNSLRPSVPFLGKIICATYKRGKAL